MTGSRTYSWLTSLLFGAAVLGWTSAGETSNPLLAASDLPREILNECAPGACAAEYEFHINWVGRTPRGSLFVVSRRACPPGSCASWLVEKDDGAAQTLLELPGTFHFHRVTGRYPAVELQTRQRDAIVRMRYEWTGGQYARTSTQPVYEVAGVECGTRDECHAVAQRAYKAKDVDRALRIWQQVDGVSWI